MCRRRFDAVPDAPYRSVGNSVRDNEAPIVTIGNDAAEWKLARERLRGAHDSANLDRRRATVTIRRAATVESNREMTEVLRKWRDSGGAHCAEVGRVDLVVPISVRVEVVDDEIAVATVCRHEGGG